MKIEKVEKMLLYLHLYYSKTVGKSFLNDVDIKLQYMDTIKSYKIDDDKEIEYFTKKIINTYTFVPSLPNLTELYSTHILQPRKQSHAKNEKCFKTNCKACEGIGYKLVKTENEEKFLVCDYCKAGDRFEHLKKENRGDRRYYAMVISDMFEHEKAPRLEPYNPEKRDNAVSTDKIKGIEEARKKVFQFPKKII